MGRPDGVLAIALGQAINADRVGGGLGRVGDAGAAVEDEIGRDLDEGRALAGGQRGQHAGAFAVDPPGGLGLGLGLVHRRIGGGRDERHETLARQGGFERFGAREIEELARQPDGFDTGGHALQQFMAKLAGGGR